MNGFLRMMEIKELIPDVCQVDVYQADFNAERQARERIAGEKADMEEELRKLRRTAAAPPTSGPAHQPGGGAFQQPGGGAVHQTGVGGGVVSGNMRERMNNFNERPPPLRPAFR